MFHGKLIMLNSSLNIVLVFLPPSGFMTVFGICFTYLAIESDKIIAAWFSVKEVKCT
jgi:hypothetical protein